MTSSEKFCLRWNDFESNISVAFREIREEKDFFDCTLSCGARQIQAHKLILSACSPFFRSILKQNPHQHPLLYLKGVEFGDLQAVLNFMYHGEVNVAQEELNSFLTVAEDLKVKGLTQNSEQTAEQKTKKEPTIAKPPSQRKADNEEQRPKPSRYLTPSAPAPAPYLDNDVQEVPPVVKQEPPTQVLDPPTHSQQMATMPQTATQPEMFSQFSHQGSTVAQVDDSYVEDGYDYGEYEGEEGAVVEYSSYQNTAAFIQGASQLCQKHDEKNYECLSCGKMFSDQSNCKRHIRIKHLGEEKNATCPNCEKQVLKTDIKRHMKKHCANKHLYQDQQELQFY